MTTFEAFSDQELSEYLHQARNEFDRRYGIERPDPKECIYGSVLLTKREMEFQRQDPAKIRELLDIKGQQVAMSMFDFWETEFCKPTTI